MIGFLATVIPLAYTVASVLFARRAYREEFRKVYGTPAPSVYGGKIGLERAHEVAIKEAYWWLVMWPFFSLWSGIELMIANGKEFRDALREEKITALQHDVDRLASDQAIVVGIDPSGPGEPGVVVATCSPVDREREMDREIIRLSHEREEQLRCQPNPFVKPYPPIGLTPADRHPLNPDPPCPCGYRTECVIHCGDGSCHEAMVRTRDDLERGAVLRVTHPEHIRVYDVGTMADPDRKLTVLEPPKPGVYHER